MRHRTQIFLYRVDVTNKSKKREHYLAELKDNRDENARRRIVHTAMAEGGHVHSIMATSDRSQQPGDKRKRQY